MRILVLTLMFLLSTVAARAQTYTETLLYNFGAAVGDGATPVSGLMLDAQGNLYGTTSLGGTNNCGTVFKISSAGAETVLHKFGCGTDGGVPLAGVVLDKAGNIYGASQFYGQYSCGTLFKITPAGKFSVMHQFGKTVGDGCFPVSPLQIDTAGNLYGLASQGGSMNAPCVGQGTVGCGVLFKVGPKGAETIVYTFTGNGADGMEPSWNLLRDGKGNLYGLAFGAGSPGVLFEISAAGKETILYAGNVGGFVARNAAGNFFGTFMGTVSAGGVGAWEVAGAAGHAYTTDYFCVACVGGSAQGWEPWGPVAFYNTIMYGTTVEGGAFFDDGNTWPDNGGGTVYSFNPATGAQAVLYSFPNPGTTTLDGWSPEGGVVKDAAGNFYGTLSGGGAFGGGAVFKLTPQ